MNFRADVLKLGLQHMSRQLGAQPMNILEIGCMFREVEGLSTLVLGEFVHSRPGGGRVLSLEYDQSHIDSCKKILGRRAPHLLQTIEFHCGHSLALLPAVLEEIGAVHLVSQDGGAHPEVCLQEFELLCGALASGGLILVDDAHELEFSQAYQLPRPMGKCTFIVPYLLLANYRKYRETYRQANAAIDGPDCIPDSEFIRKIMKIELPDIEPRDFAVLDDRHRMLVYGDAGFADRARELVQQLRVKAQAAPSIAGRLKAFVRKIGARLTTN